MPPARIGQLLTVPGRTQGTAQCSQARKGRACMCMAPTQPPASLAHQE